MPNAHCGLMLLQIKSGLSHGEWLPWLNGEIAAGRLEVGERQARRYMQVASNRTRESNLLEATSIRAMCKPAYDERTVATTVCCSTENADAGGGIKPNQQQPQLTGDEIMMKVDGMSDRLECWRWKRKNRR